MTFSVWNFISHKIFLIFDGHLRIPFIGNYNLKCWQIFQCKMAAILSWMFLWIFFSNMDMPILHNFLICFLHTIWENVFFVHMFTKVSSFNHLLLNCIQQPIQLFPLLGNFSQTFERLRISFFFSFLCF